MSSCSRCATSRKAGISHDISLQLHKGEILGVFGLMGSGRSELAEIIFGLEGFDSGEVLIDGSSDREALADQEYP